jgi:adenine-specific DNA-methyltransferase
VYEIKNPNGEIFLPTNGKRWSLSQDSFKEALKDNRVWFGKNGTASPRIKRFLSEVKNGVTASTILPFSEAGHTGEGKKELISILGQDVFSNPKPEKLLQRIIHIATKKGDLVLDYHLGSGTTCAVAHKIKLSNNSPSFLTVAPMTFCMRLTAISSI